MDTTSVLQSNGTYATRVDVLVYDDDDEVCYTNGTTLVSRRALSAFEAEHAAIILMEEQVEREYNELRVIGAMIVRPTDTASQNASAS